nr:hypothetical protein [Citrobacter amalonaticus]
MLALTFICDRISKLRAFQQVNAFHVFDDQVRSVEPLHVAKQ